MSVSDAAFAGSVPQIYETYLVPLIFDPYARDLAGRAVKRAPRRVLEIAAGTGVVTRYLAQQLPPDVEIVATDLNQAMLDIAARMGTSRPVEWRVADAMQLPFANGEFDLVVAQFGAMFFPDKTKAYAEVRRVLRDGGAFLFNVWENLEANEFPYVVTESLTRLFPENPPLFLKRTPYAYFDRETIERDVRAAGYNSVHLETVTHRSKADSPRGPAIGFVQGTPMRTEIDAARLEEATDVAAKAIAERVGEGAVDGQIQAVIVEAER